MGAIVIARPDLSDAATLTVGNELPALPGENLQMSQLSRRWQSSGLSNLSVIVDLGAPPNPGINLVTLVATNATTAATWRIRAATSQANLTASPGYDSGTIAMLSSSDLANWNDRLALKWLATAQSFRWWRIDITDAGNPDGYFRAGRLYIASAWQAMLGLQYDWGLGFIDDSPKLVSEGGQVWIDERRRRRNVRGTISLKSEDEAYSNVFDLMRLRGSARDILLIRDPNATTHLHRQTIYGRLLQLQPIVNPYHDFFTWQFEVEELI
jgi:hypothetical protein